MLDNLNKSLDNQKTESSDGSSSKNEETSRDTGTFTAEEVQKLISDALSKAGRDAKNLNSKEIELKQREERIKAEADDIANAKRELDLREIEAVKEDPQAIKTIEYRQKLAERERELTRREREVNEKLSNAQAAIKELNDRKFNDEIRRISGAYGVDETVLKDLGIDDIDKVEAIAKRLPSTKKVQTDSGKTTGGEYFTREQIADRKFWTANKDAILKAQKEGRIK